jgi:hypothetical protein
MSFNLVVEKLLNLRPLHIQHLAHVVPHIILKGHAHVVRFPPPFIVPSNILRPTYSGQSTCSF